jgi:hypothetical protein
MLGVLLENEPHYGHIFMWRYRARFDKQNGVSNSKPVLANKTVF